MKLRQMAAILLVIVAFGLAVSLWAMERFSAVQAFVLVVIAFLAALPISGIRISRQKSPTKG